MTRKEALQLLIDLSGNEGKLDEATGFRTWNFPEVVKEALMNSDNHIHNIEDKMVEAISVLTGLPEEWLPLDTAEAVVPE